MNEALKRELVEICKLLYVRGLTRAWGGNVSALGEGTNQIIITPRNTPLLDVSLDKVVVTTLEGVVVEGGAPSTELPLHCAIYLARPDIKAIVHVHSLYSTVFAILEKPIELLATESKILIGELPLVPYADPGSEKLAKLVTDQLKQKNRACILTRHGVVAGGQSLKDAYYLAELVEETARLNFLVKLIR